MRRHVKTIAAPNESDTALTLALVLGLFGVLAAIGSTGGPRHRPCSSWRPAPASADSLPTTPPVSRGSPTSQVKNRRKGQVAQLVGSLQALPVRRSQHPERGST